MKGEKGMNGEKGVNGEKGMKGKCHTTCGHMPRKNYLSFQAKRA